MHSAGGRRRATAWQLEWMWLPEREESRITPEFFGLSNSKAGTAIYRDGEYKKRVWWGEKDGELGVLNI